MKQHELARADLPQHPGAALRGLRDVAEQPGPPVRLLCSLVLLFSLLLYVSLLLYGTH